MGVSRRPSRRTKKRMVHHVTSGSDGSPGRPVTVAVIADPAGAYVRGLIAGITAFGRDNGRWRFKLYPDHLALDLPARVRADRVDGVLARILDRRIGRGLARVGVPLVDMLEEIVIPGVPQIVVDDRAVARLALDHLLDRGLTTIAFLGIRGVRYSEQRCRFLAEECRERAGALVAYPTGDARDPLTLRAADNVRGETREGIGRWIAALPKPVGLVACNDVWASTALAACVDSGLEVPEQVAVIGVDDDPTFGQLADPPLSSVDPDTHTIGYRAAGLLAQLMAGEGGVPTMTFVEPRGVVARRSTDTLAFADAAVADLVRYVREHACDGLTVERMSKRLGISRRTIERLFAEHVGRSPSEEICRVRLMQVKTLLETTDLDLYEVAQRTGFNYVKSLRRAFEGRIGMTPSKYRATKRSAGDGPGMPGRRR
jgi:LacI family transcriptional regulator